MPITNSSARRRTGVIAPAVASTARAIAASSISDCEARITRRRSRRSPSTPDGTASSKTGMLPAAGIALSRSAELVKEIITHCAATVCIQDPTLLVNCADHSRRNSR
jgi:hypothetical protein